MKYTILRQSKIFMNTHVNTSIIQWPADNEVHRRENLCISHSVYSINWIICTHSGISISCITHTTICSHGQLRREEGRTRDLAPTEFFPAWVKDDWEAQEEHTSVKCRQQQYYWCGLAIFIICWRICTLAATVPAKSIRGARKKTAVCTMCAEVVNDLLYQLP